MVSSVLPAYSAETAEPPHMHACMHAYYIMSVRLDICHNSSRTGTKTLPVLVPMVPVLINSLVKFVERINELATAEHPCHHTRL